MSFLDRSVALGDLLYVGLAILALALVAWAVSTVMLLRVKAKLRRMYPGRVHFRGRTVVIDPLPPEERTHAKQRQSLTDRGGGEKPPARPPMP